MFTPFASGMFSSFVSMLITFIKCSSTFMISSSFLMSVFFSSLRFTGSSGGGTNVIGRLGDFAINRLFTNTFSFASSFGLSRSCASGTTLGSDASSVVIGLGFCGVSTTALTFSSDQRFSASRRTPRANTSPSSVRTRCSSVRSRCPSHTSNFHLSANFGGFPDPFPTPGRCARTASPNSTNFPRYGPPMARQNGDCISLSNSSECTHDFSVHPSARKHAFTVCVLTKYTSPFLISGSCPSPNLNKDSFARYASTPFSHKQLTHRIGFVTSTTWKSYCFV